VANRDLRVQPDITCIYSSGVVKHWLTFPSRRRNWTKM